MALYYHNQNNLVTYVSHDMETMAIELKELVSKFRETNVGTAEAHKLVYEFRKKFTSLIINRLN